MSTLPFSVDAQTMRKIEWWALLNCFVRPTDLPSGADEKKLFAELTRTLPTTYRMEFWNGAFRGGKSKNLFL